MKRTLCLIILSLSMFSLNLVAQSKDEKSVAEAVEIFRKGVVDADRSTLNAIAAEELVYGHSNGKVQNKAEFVEEIVSNDPFDYLTVNISDQTIKIAGNTAIVRHTLSADTKNTSGAAGKVLIGNMLIWQKQHGKWKLLARQAYRK